LPFLRITDHGVYLQILVAPQSRINKLIGIHGDRLKIQIHAAPEAGKANKELIDFLKSILLIPRQQITLVQGEANRKKTVLVTGLDAKTLRMRLGPQTSLAARRTSKP
jgi:uncharacterized protein (TIGR00251 family)